MIGILTSEYNADMESSPAKVTVVELGPAAAPAPARQEIDLWWGSWSGWTMLPSILISVVLTGLIVGWAWTFVDRRFVQLTVWTLAGCIWLVQILRWSLRYFGCNYRLTTRRLILYQGHLRTVFVILPLNSIQQVRIVPYSHSRWTGVKRLLIRTQERKGEIELGGVAEPQRVADLIREASGKVKDEG